MKAIIITINEKTKKCRVKGFGKFTYAEYADILAGAYAEALVNSMKDCKIPSYQMADFAIRAIRQNIENKTKERGTR